MPEAAKNEARRSWWPKLRALLLALHVAAVLLLSFPGSGRLAIAAHAWLRSVSFGTEAPKAVRTAVTGRVRRWTRSNAQAVCRHGKARSELATPGPVPARHSWSSIRKTRSDGPKITAV